MFDLDQLVTVADIPRLNARVRGDGIAQIFEGRETSFAEFDRRTSRVANALLGTVSGPQVRIGFLGKNSDRYFELVLGACKANVVLTGINWRLAAPEVEYIMNDADCEMLFVGAEYYALAAAIRDNCPSLKIIVAMDEAHADWPVSRLLKQCSR